MTRYYYVTMPNEQSLDDFRFGFQFMQWMSSVPVEASRGETAFEFGVVVLERNQADDSIAIREVSFHYPGATNKKGLKLTKRLAPGTTVNGAEYLGFGPVYIKKPRPKTLYFDFKLDIIDKQSREIISSDSISVRGILEKNSTSRLRRVLEGT